MTLLHVSSIVGTLLVVLYADEQGLQYLRGKVATLPRKRVMVLHALVAVGLTCIILTGARMVYEDPAYYFSQPLYWAKMSFVAVLIINAFFIGHLSRIALTTPFAELSLRARLPLLVSGAVSLVAWVATILLGLALSGWW
jgi:hypothetical protein